MKGRNPQSHDNAAKDTHLKCLDPADAGNGSIQYIRRNAAIRQDLSAVDQHRIDGNMHDQKGNHGRKSCHLFLRLSHADGHTYSKNNRQIVKDYISGLRHDN